MKNLVLLQLLFLALTSCTPTELPITSDQSDNTIVKTPVLPDTVSTPKSKSFHMDLTTISYSHADIENSIEVKDSLRICAMSYVEYDEPSKVLHIKTIDVHSGKYFQNGGQNTYTDNYINIDNAHTVTDLIPDSKSQGYYSFTLSEKISPYYLKRCFSGQVIK